MAINRDSNSNGNTASGSSLTISHTCTGTNLILWVAAYTDSGTLSGVTYNSIAMTQVTGSPINFIGTRRVYLYYLVNPSTGTHNIVITNSSSAVITGLGASYVSSKQTGVPEVVSTPQSSTSAFSATCTLTTTTNGDWGIMVLASLQTPTAGANTSQVAFNGAGSEKLTLYDTNGPITPAGSASMNATFGSGEYGALMVGMAPDGLPVTASVTDTLNTTDIIAPQRILVSTLTDTINSIDALSNRLGWKTISKSSGPSWIDKIRS